MKDPSRTASCGGKATSPRPEDTDAQAGCRAVTAICSVCQEPFAAKKNAKTCSGRCRMVASRGRRVGDLVVKIEMAEKALADAGVALGKLRELAAAGSSKVMP